MEAAPHSLFPSLLLLLVTVKIKAKAKGESFCCTGFFCSLLYSVPDETIFEAELKLLSVECIL